MVLGDNSLSRKDMALSDLHSEAASLTTHALDIARGAPAANLAVRLFRLEGARQLLVSSAFTNAEGRCNAPLLTRAQIKTGTYMLEFDAASYHGCAFPFGSVPVEFDIADLEGHYHVPLVLAPGGYSTYRGAPPSRLPDDKGAWGPIRARVDLPSRVRAPSPGVGGAGLTIHAIDLARGIGATSLEGEIMRREGTDRWTSIGRFVVNGEGRTDCWLIEAGGLASGDYELWFEAGDYYARAGFGVGAIPFFRRIRVRVRVDNTAAHHHVPLLLSPWGYSCYRGS
jgi:5-hydroxyisourate hydrolase